MRINVYAEELTEEVALTSKTVDPDTDAERVFYGLRWFQHSSDKLHYSPEDDDRQAITIWVPWRRNGGHQIGSLKSTLQEMIHLLDSIPED